MKQLQQDDQLTCQLAHTNCLMLQISHTHWTKISNIWHIGDKERICCIKLVPRQVHCFSVRIINPLTNGQMVIKLAANKFLLQNDFLIWEELLLCEKYIFWIFDAKLCSVPGNHWELIWAYCKNKIFGILRKIISSLKNQFTHLTKLHLLKVFELYITIVFFAWLMIVRLKIELIYENGTLFLFTVLHKI